MLNKIFFILIVIIVSGCFHENGITDSETTELELNALLLREIEARGDFINTSRTSLFPCYIRADSLYKSLSEYEIIDVRSHEDFSVGYIEGSINLSNSELFDYIVKQSSSQEKEFIIVSYSGQAASFYTYLFRAYGLNNVYSLLFGMASWHKDFSDEILQYANNNSIGGSRQLELPEKKYNMPYIDNPSSKNIQELLNERIQNLFKEGFEEKPLDSSSLYIHSKINTINFNELDENFHEYYVACFGTKDFYGTGHLPGTVLYYPFAPMSDIQSTYELQTFPPDKKIAVYSYSGHLSALLTAHLRLLGYDAKSIIFGGFDGEFSYMQNAISAAKAYAYAYEGAKNFPYVK